MFIGIIDLFDQSSQVFENLVPLYSEYEFQQITINPCPAE